MIPEHGQIVRLRHQAWAVTGVTSYGKGANLVHRVGLENLSDESLGKEIQVIWEREVVPVILETGPLPAPKKFDNPQLFDAFISAIRWSCSSVVEGAPFQAPFRGGIEIEPYQLVPLHRAMQMPRIRQLIADDVGLGKTIEAGLIAQELIHSHRASRVLIVCPAHLKEKWADEMADKFGLAFKIIDSDSVSRIKNEYGPTINPWASNPRLITSLDYLKQEHPTRQFLEFANNQAEQSPGVRPWDLLILDEAHNVAPAGRKSYVKDSDRTLLIRRITRLFEHKLFLTATPHNGYRPSFTGLLELLDSLRFTRGAILDKQQQSAVQIRRLKREIKNPDGSHRFPKRRVFPRDRDQDPDYWITLTDLEAELFDLLKRYRDSRLASSTKRAKQATEFVLTLLKKRALSSPASLRESLVTHSETVGHKTELEIGDSLFKRLRQKEEQEDWESDKEKDETSTSANEEASRLMVSLSGDEKSWLKRAFEITELFANTGGFKPDSKASALISWINANLRSNGEWSGERVIIFTEYRHTLLYLEAILQSAGFGGAIGTISGGMPDKDRKAINEAFQSPDSQTPIRILLATDAASEGADFQRHCHNLFHYDIPWNPVRLEQRNGRIDRHGQKAKEVNIHHYVYKNQEDSQFLEHIVKKVEAIREDIGSVGSVIARDIRSYALGKKVDIDKIDKNPALVEARKDLNSTGPESDVIHDIANALIKSKQDLGLTNEGQLEVLRLSLALDGQFEAVESNENGSFTVQSLPPSRGECLRFLSTEFKTQPLTFKHELAEEDEGIGLVHLGHPLMQRAVSKFRMQMWGGLSHTQNMSRACIKVVSGLSKPIVSVWGRLVMMGAGGQQLHEGLVNIVAEVNGQSVAKVSTPMPLECQKFEGDFEYVADLLKPLLPELTALLTKQADTDAAHLTDILTARGELAAKQATDLAIERIAEIRKTIKQNEKESEQPQIKIQFEDDELGDWEPAQNLERLRYQLIELNKVKTEEPKRARITHKVASNRCYPIALEVHLPEGF